jgi:putative Holliday junction resolvase
MNILAVDYGKKNIGLAWYQDGIDVVLPFGRLKGKTEEERVTELAKLIESERIGLVAVGLPINLQSAETVNTRHVREFADKLQKQAKIKVEFIDERFTSAQADRMGNDGASRDEKAAMLILQTYLDRQTL